MDGIIVFPLSISVVWRRAGKGAEPTKSVDVRMKGEEGMEGEKEGVKEGGESDAKLLNHFRVRRRPRLTVSEEKKKK